MFGISEPHSLFCARAPAHFFLSASFIFFCSVFLPLSFSLSFLSVFFFFTCCLLSRSLFALFSFTCFYKLACLSLGHQSCFFASATLFLLHSCHSLSLFITSLARSTACRCVRTYIISSYYPFSTLFLSVSPLSFLSRCLRSFLSDAFFTSLNTQPWARKYARHEKKAGNTAEPKNQAREFRFSRQRQRTEFASGLLSL